LRGGGGGGAPPPRGGGQVGRVDHTYLPSQAYLPYRTE
jgi:hypothetical protein